MEFFGAFVVMIICVVSVILWMRYQTDGKGKFIAFPAIIIGMASVVVTDGWLKIFLLASCVTLFMLALNPKKFEPFFVGYDRTICGVIGVGITSFVILFWKTDKGNILPAWGAVLVSLLSVCLTFPMIRLYVNDFREYRDKKNFQIH
jgi:hypothetical protein